MIMLLTYWQMRLCTIAPTNRGDLEYPDIWNVESNQPGQTDLEIALVFIYILKVFWDFIIYMVYVKLLFCTNQSR